MTTIPTTEQTSADEKDELSLKWGTLKAWHMKSPAAQAAMKNYCETGRHSASAMAQHDTDEQTAALLDLIDALNCDTVYLDWEGKDVTKEEAKEYVRNYGKKHQ